MYDVVMDLYCNCTNRLMFDNTFATGIGLLLLLLLLLLWYMFYQICIMCILLDNSCNSQL
jgi:hypothetical protein